jgi:UTP pyrophosphatase
MSQRPTPYWPSFHGAKQPSQTSSQADPEQTLDQAMRYIAHYPEQMRTRVHDMIEAQTLHDHLLQRYPVPHEINSSKLLRVYTNQIKSQYLRSSERLSKICFDDKLHLIHHALGTQSFISLAHGGRLKSRRELRISSLFKRCPEPLLRMIVVHELAHLKEREHNQSFYRLCIHMEARYHQLEFDARLYLIHKELFGSIYSQV